MKIAISGQSGCGNTTATKLVGRRFNLRIINYTFHSLAVELGIPFDELCIRADGDTSYDLYIDKRQVEMARDGNCVLGSRLAVWLCRDADLTVYLTAPIEVRAARISKREGIPIEECIRLTAERDRRDTERYKSLYGIDNTDYSFVDLTIDTAPYNQYEVADLIVHRVNNLIKKTDLDEN